MICCCRDGISAEEKYIILNLFTTGKHGGRYVQDKASAGQEVSVVCRVGLNLRLKNCSCVLFAVLIIKLLRNEVVNRRAVSGGVNDNRKRGISGVLELSFWRG